MFRCYSASLPSRRQGAVLALGAAVACGWLLYRTTYRFLQKRRNYRAIKDLQQREVAVRCQVKGQLDANDDSAILLLPFSTLQADLQSGKLTPVQVLRAFQRKALEITEKTNCVTQFVPDVDKAIAKLDLIKSNKPALFGLPFSVKECFLLNGTETTAGFSGNIGRYVEGVENALLVQFLEGLGAIPFCKTNNPQGLLSFDSRNPVFGLTTNLHDATRGPGGSSSGEGVLIAGGGAPIGIGGDIGGSLRIPAAWNGCYTLKPTSSRSLSGGSILSQRAVSQGMASHSFYGRDVETLITLFRLLYSRQTFEKFPMNTASLAPVAFREDVFQSSESKLRIGYFDFNNIMQVVPAAQRALLEAKIVLERAGHILVPWVPPDMHQAIIRYASTICVDGLVEFQKDASEDVEISYQNKLLFASNRWPPWFTSLISILIRPIVGKLPAEIIGKCRHGLRPHDVNVAYNGRLDYQKTFSKNFHDEKLDAILCPAFPCPALPVNSPRDCLGAVSYTALFNLVDWPAGVVPVTKVCASDEQKMADYPTHDQYHQTIKKGCSFGTVGLPIAVQLVAPPFCEEVVLKLMETVAAAVHYH